MAETDFLSRVTDARQQRVQEMMARTSARDLRDQLGPPPPAGRLERALRRGDPAGPLRLLCEVKRASPSKGVLNESVDPVRMARIYEQEGAAAVSLVTEPDFFQGELEWIDRVRPVTRLPILLKDFVVDPYQLLDAAVRGADGVLLLAAILSDVLLQKLVSESKLLGLDALVEVHALDELHRAIRAGATLVGINNRDLRTFEVDLETSIRLMPHVPPLVTAVAESGLSAPEDLARLRDTRCDAVLIGEALMTSADPAATLMSLAGAARG